MNILLIEDTESIIKGLPIAEPGIPESFKVLVKELQALGLDVKILTDGNKEISLSELSQDEQDQNTPIVQETEKDLEESIFDFDNQKINEENGASQEEENKELNEVFEEITKNDTLEGLDLFDDFGDFDE